MIDGYEIVIPTFAASSREPSSARPKMAFELVPAIAAPTVVAALGRAPRSTSAPAAPAAGPGPECAGRCASGLRGGLSSFELVPVIASALPGVSSAPAPAALPPPAEAPRPRRPGEGPADRHRGVPGANAVVAAGAASGLHAADRPPERMAARPEGHAAMGSQKRLLAHGPAAARYELVPLVANAPRPPPDLRPAIARADTPGPRARAPARPSHAP